MQQYTANVYGDCFDYVLDGTELSFNINPPHDMRLTIDVTASGTRIKKKTQLHPHFKKGMGCLLVPIMTLGPILIDPDTFSFATLGPFLGLIIGGFTAFAFYSMIRYRKRLIFTDVGTKENAILIQQDISNLAAYRQFISAVVFAASEQTPANPA